MLCSPSDQPNNALQMNPDQTAQRKPDAEMARRISGPPEPESLTLNRVKAAFDRHAGERKA
jgi:hypothetical protein